MLLAALVLVIAGACTEGPVESSPDPRPSGPTAGGEPTTTDPSALVECHVDPRVDGGENWWEQWEQIQAAYNTRDADGLVGLVGDGRVFDPFVNALNSTPGAAFIPLIVVWFGLYTEAKVVLVWNAAFFPILINTAAGIANANRELVEMGRAFGANRRVLFRDVMLPDALPSILSGLRIGAAIATVGTVIAELTMAQSGLGGLLAQAGNRFQMDKYFAVVIVLMILGTTITATLRYAERRIGRWRATT